MKTIFYRNSLLLIACLAICIRLSAQTEMERKSIESIKKNYIRAIVGQDKEKKKLLELLATMPREKEVSDQNVIELQQLYPIAASEIKELIGALRSDGSWADIDYTDTKRSGWEPKIHAERVLKLAKYYYSQKQAKASGTNEIGAAIHKTMNFWFDGKLACKNWWYNQIGIPRTLGPAFLLFEQEMNEAEKKCAIEVMKQSKLGMTGQNKVWLAGNVLIRGLLQNDFELVMKAQSDITSEITLGQQEGIKEDWSFHQHGPQQQFGNYGLSFLNNMSFYSQLFAETPLAFSREQQQIVVSLLLEGYQWIIWRGYWDVNGLNRQLFKNADVDKAFLLLFSAYSLMKNSNDADAQRINDFILRNLPASRRVPNAFIGNKHFWESDFTVHRTPRWMASLRMASSRVIGTELVNEDNLKGYYMADGALYVYFRGDEYHNLFPFWDWRRIPGITTYESNAPIPNANRKDARNQTPNVGGATDGTTGITSMQLKRNGLTAHKAWIFTSEYVLCLGSNIHSDSTATLITSIDQRFSKGKVWNSRNERFFHDSTGYIVLQADTCVALTEKKQGRWHDFMGMYAPAMLEDHLFSIYLKHKKEAPDSYIYMILPGCTKEQVEMFDRSSIHILRNDEQAQIVSIDGIAYMTIYQNMEVDLGNHTHVRITAPGNYMANMRDGKFIASAPFSY